MTSLQKKVLDQKNQEEQKRLRKIQEQIDLEKSLKEAEERKRIEDDEHKKK